FSFAYSERGDTKAVDLEPSVQSAERFRRLEVLQALQETITKSRLHEMVGRRTVVLSEGPSKTDPTRWSGRTGHNRVVHVDGQAEPGRMVEVELIEAFNHSLLGRPA